MNVESRAIAQPCLTLSRLHHRQGAFYRYLQPSKTTYLILVKRLRGNSLVCAFRKDAKFINHLSTFSQRRISNPNSSRLQLGFTNNHSFPSTCNIYQSCTLVFIKLLGAEKRQQRHGSKQERPSVKSRDRIVDEN